MSGGVLEWTEQGLFGNTARTVAGSRYGDILQFLTDRIGYSFSLDGVTDGLTGLRLASSEHDFFCPADFNRDGIVDALDVQAFIACFEGESCPPDRGPDLNADLFPDFFDYEFFMTAFEVGC
jgi:hypothetical protein